MMNIAMGFDTNFAPYAAVTIKSILLHNKNVKFYIMYDNLDKKDMKKLSGMIDEGENCSVEWIDMTGKFDHLSAGSWKSKSVYFPVALPTLCPDDRILFLDADILVTDNLEPLYNKDMTGYYLAGARDCGLIVNFMQNTIQNSKTHGGRVPSQDYFKEVFGYTKPEDFSEYLNGGILLMNLAEMRRDDIENKMYDLFNKIDFAFNEQDCFNYICRGKTKVLAPEEAVLVVKEEIIDNLPDDLKHAYLENYDENKKHLIVHLIKKPWRFPEDHVLYSKMFNEVRGQTPYRFHRDKKEIFKFNFGKRKKYLVLFGHTIFKFS